MEEAGKIPQVVIIGGGFAGLYAAQKFKNRPVQVTLIDRRNFHLFQPLLYQVATGGLSPADIASPLRGILKKHRNVQVIMEEVLDINPDDRSVIAFTSKIHYDFLVVASGASHHYFGNTHWEKFSPGLKTIEDATKIRSIILQAFELAEIEQNPERKNELLTFVIIGAGPTGLELAGAIGEMALHTLKTDFRNISTPGSEIYLVEAAERILPSFPSQLSQKAAQSLGKLNVKILTASRVLDIAEDGVTVKRGDEVIHFRTSNIIWAAGVKASDLGKIIAAKSGEEIDKQGRIIVNEYCRLKNYPEIYVIGDLANFKDKSGQSLPGIAPIAMQQGQYASKTILATISHKEAKPFVYWDKGNLAVIGRKAAVAKLGNFCFSGYFAWLLWLFIHLMYLVEFENRLLVFIQWAFNYFTRNRSARLIAHADRNSPTDH
ncbi:MAG: pyridine nucleotide-disulfide oxidoreductase [Caldithrix sp. RBG_13_44_9]|nr:MAG: pyridine nucleotide-disulfide oxidoreductase [Caldithrix sp. RBG_13_44_9]